MSKDWDYARLSKEAKESGGPERYIESIYEQGAADRDDLYKIVLGLSIPTALGVGYLLKGLVNWIRERLRRKSHRDYEHRLASNSDFQQAHDKLLNNIQIVDDEPGMCDKGEEIQNDECHLPEL